MLTPAIVAAARKIFGVAIVDLYSANELGNVALQCPKSGNYHVQSESVLVEVLDDRGAPCRPGEIGRVVVTSLHNYATPLVRYVIGDYAEVGAPCPCGRGLPTLKRVVGRVRNMLCLPSGEKRWPLVGFAEFRDIAPIRQYQFEQKSLEEIEARFVADRPLTPAEEAKLTALIQASLDHPFQISFNYPPELRPRPNGKFEEFISAIAR
jgi:phenylacetate-CoA ligase